MALTLSRKLNPVHLPLLFLTALWLRKHTTFKYLGFIFSDSCNWKTHIKLSPKKLGYDSSQSSETCSAEARAKASPTELSSSELSCSICKRQLRTKIGLIRHLPSKHSLQIYRVADGSITARYRFIKNASWFRTYKHTHTIWLGLAIVSNDRRPLIIIIIAMLRRRPSSTIQRSISLMPIGQSWSNCMWRINGKSWNGCIRFWDMPGQT